MWPFHFCIAEPRDWARERESKGLHADLQSWEVRPTSSSWRCDACDRHDPKPTTPFKGKAEFTKLMHSALAVQPVKPAAPKIHDISPETTCMFIKGSRLGWTCICATSPLRQEMQLKRLVLESWNILLQHKTLHPGCLCLLSQFTCTKARDASQH